MVPALPEDPDVSMKRLAPSCCPASLTTGTLAGVPGRVTVIDDDEIGAPGTLVFEHGISIPAVVPEVSAGGWLACAFGPSNDLRTALRVNGTGRFRSVASCVGFPMS